MKQTTTSTFTDEEREAAAAAYEARREALKFTQYTDRCKTCERLFMKTSAIHVFCSAPCRVKDHHTEKGRIIWMLDKALERAREEIAGLRAEREELLTDMRGRNEREIELAEELARLKARMKAE